MMATRKGLVKKTALKAYSRPLKSGIIAIKLKEGDELVDVRRSPRPGDEIVLATANGMAIRFSEADARPMGRNTSGVKGIKLGKGDYARRHGRRRSRRDAAHRLRERLRQAHAVRPERPHARRRLPRTAKPPRGDDVARRAAEAPAPKRPKTTKARRPVRYRTQRRGGKGLRDIKTTDRNGPVIGIVRVRDDDELLMMTARGKIQRIAVSDISVIGRNTQGVRIMSLDEGDTLAAVVRVPREEREEGEEIAEAPQ